MILTASINEVTRKITFDNPHAVVAVVGDYEVNGVAFAFPSIYEDDFNLSEAVKTVYYEATDGNIYNHIVTETDTDTGYPLWVFKDEINKGEYGDVDFALVCDKVENGTIVKRWVSLITVFRVQRSIPIDEAAQEDNEQTYSERLAYLMTQMANMQATVSGLASGAPTPVGLASAMTDTSRLYVYTGSESGYTAGHWYYYNGSAWADGGQYGGVAVDDTLTQSGLAADAKATGDEIAEIKEDLSAVSGLSAEVKQALLACFAKVAWTDENGQDYYDALEDALYPPVTLVSISAVYTQSVTVYTTDTLNSLKPDLVVTAHYSDSTSSVVTGYTLSGTLAEGTSTVTVSYSGKTDTFDVVVTRYAFYDYLYNSHQNYNNADDAYVDTGLTYAPSFTTLNIEFEAENNNTASTSIPLVCANNQSTSDTGNVVWYARTNKGGFSAYNLGVAKQLNTVPGDTRAVIKYRFVDGGESYMEWNGTTVAVATKSKSSVATNNKSLILMGGYSFSSGSKYNISDSKAKLGYVKFTDPATDTLLYHFIPAYDTVTDKYGYWEDVNGVFYPDTSTYLRGGNWGA